MAVAHRNRLHRQGAIQYHRRHRRGGRSWRGYAATAHLIEHGHRRIGFIGDSSSIATTAGRLDGYYAALADAGIDAGQRFVSLGAMSSREAAEATWDLLSRPDAPTALFSSNARCSIGVVPALQESDRTDIALVGYGDFPLASALRPALTVIDQNPDALGRPQRDGCSSGLTTQRADGSDAWSCLCDCCYVTPAPLPGNIKPWR